MNRICRAAVYTPRSPESMDPPRVYRCKHCREDIVQGEEYVELEGEFYHQECFEDNAVRILMEDYGAIKGVAEIERWEW